MRVLMKSPGDADDYVGEIVSSGIEVEEEERQQSWKASA